MINWGALGAVSLVSLAAVQHPRKAFQAGAAPRVPAPAGSADVMVGDAVRS